jgi:hypothetical protein
MSKLYSATSLEDIAQMFDRLAQSSQTSADKANGFSAKQRDLSLREAITWRAAAAMLRNTDLTEDDETLNEIAADNEAARDDEFNSPREGDDA